MPLIFSQPDTGKIPFGRLFVFSLLLLITDTVSARSPLEYDARLCTAGIVVLSADINKLQQTGVSDHERNWLEQRVDGLLSTIVWLCRRHSELNSLSRSASIRLFETLRDNVGEKKWPAALDRLSELSSRFPLLFTVPTGGKISETTARKGKSIYDEYCQGCHLISRPQQTPPVYSLAAMAKSLAAEEFLARMIIGVHGTPDIALRNPLSDHDIVGIYAYLLELDVD